MQVQEGSKHSLGSFNTLSPVPLFYLWGEPPKRFILSGLGNPEGKPARKRGQCQQTKPRVTKAWRQLFQRNCYEKVKSREQERSSTILGLGEWAQLVWSHLFYRPDAEEAEKMKKLVLFKNLRRNEESRVY